MFFIMGITDGQKESIYVKAAMYMQDTPYL